MRIAGTTILLTGLLGAGLAVQPVLAQTAATPGRTTTAPTPGQSANTQAQMSTAAKTFATHAAMSSMAEIQLSQMAQQKAQSADVKQFAQQMITDHNKAKQDLMTIAQQQNMTLPTTLDQQHQAAANKLKGLSGGAFDAAFMQQMVQDHQKAVDLFQKEASNGHDQALKNYAQKYVPVLQQHLQKAQSVSSNLS